MKALNETPINLRAVGITMILAALAIALLAVALTVGPAWAQGPGGNTDGGNTGYVNLSTYPNPQPCGPGAGDAFMQEPHEITSGHYALFDAYWRTISKGERDIDVAGVGVLHTNLCPPLVAQTTKTQDFETVTATTRSARNGGMDVDEAIIHVLDKHKATTSATSTSTGYLSLAEYPAVKKYAPAGSPVWWLRLDDPRSTSTDEASDLGIGFSTELLKDKRWGPTMRYRFLVERHPNDPTDVPHFFAYESPDVRAESPKTGVKLVWDSTRAGEGEILLNPGEYKDLQWVFTKPGTYLLWVHLLGDVKKPRAGENWKPLSGNDTETSEVYRYTIQVGSDLDETEPPIFGVNRSVAENSFGGTKVGDPIPVYNAEADVLYYDLTGDGHSNFYVEAASTDPHTAQIMVADGADLDYETEPTSYQLNLSVTDKLDHEHNKDPKVDDVLIVKIDLEDRPAGLELRASGSVLGLGETVNLVAKYEPTQEQRGKTPIYQWAEPRQTLNDGVKWFKIDTAPNAPTWSISHSSPTVRTYRVAVALVNDDDSTTTFVNSNEVIVFWQ